MNTIEQIKEWLVGYCGGNASSDFTFKEVAHAISVFIKEEYAGASAMNGSAGVPAIDMDKAANLIINRLDDLGREYSDEYGLPTQNENKCQEMKQIVLKSFAESVSSPSPLEAETADKKNKQ